MTAHRDVIVEALIELADASYQQRVWAADDPNEMLSFVECIERLFDDSGLAIALSHGSAFGPPSLFPRGTGADPGGVWGW